MAKSTGPTGAAQDPKPPSRRGRRETLPELLGEGAQVDKRDNRLWAYGLLWVIGFLVIVSLLLQFG